jgi:sugar phosphate isomerase/epimerase
MPQLKIGVQLASLRQPVKRALQIASQIGAEAVEIDALHEIRPQDLTQTGLRQIRKLLENLSLRVSAVSLPTRLGYDVEDDLERRVAATRAAMRMAQQLGAAVVVNSIGRVPEAPEGTRWQTLLAALTDLGSWADHFGAVLAARTGVDSGPDLARLLTALPEGSLGIDLDPGNLIVHGHSPLEAVAAVGRSIRHVHATDGVQDLAQGRGLRVELGRGSADYPALLAALGEQGYNGWLTIAGPSDGNPASAMGNAVRYLRSF